jgi:alpha/beta superfamily hydrolase
MPLEPVTCTTRDGIELEAEWDAPADAVATAVLCHPHPQYGGTMRSMVTSALFSGLPDHGIAVLRFNFRGVEGSGGTHGEGRDEPDDVRAALDVATAHGRGPVVIVGWSFGADMALTVDDPRVAGWVAIAPPLRFRPAAEYGSVGGDVRPKLLILAAHDEFRAPDEVSADVAAWRETRVEVVPGASHFFVGRADRVVTLTTDFVRGLREL